MDHEQSDDGLTQPATWRMIKCDGCGFSVERKRVQEWGDQNANPAHWTTCTRCARCTPDVREAYRRGFNAGLDAMAAAVDGVAKHSNLRKRARDE